MFVAMSYNDNALIVAVYTLMNPVHTMLKFSAEMVFVNAWGNMDRKNARVFMLLMHSAVGQLPLCFKCRR